MRSASTPPIAPNTRIGRNCSAAVRPTAVPVPGELHDQPHLGDGLHPVAGQRDHLAGEVAPVVGDAQGEEGAVQGGGHLLAALLEHPLEDRGGAVQRLAVGGRPARRCAGRGRRPCGRAAASSSARPSSEMLTSEERRSCGIGGALDQPGLLEAREHARDRRALDALALGELGRGQRPVALDRRERGGLRRARAPRRPPGAGGAPCARCPAAGGRRGREEECVRTAN